MKPQPVRSLASLRRQVDASNKHARGCKKAPSECKVCREVIRWFNDLPAAALSQVLAE